MIDFEKNMNVETYFFQSGQTITQFEGIRIASVSSALPTKDRHTEFDIFLTYPHKEWILQGWGRTKLPGETDRGWAVISKEPSDVLQAVLGNDVSRLAKRLIAETMRNLADDIFIEDTTEDE